MKLKQRNRKSKDGEMRNDIHARLSIPKQIESQKYHHIREAMKTRMLVG